MLTEEAVKRAAAGKTRSDTTQRTIEEITARVEENVQTFQQIVASTNQQQLGIEQVMGALQNIRQASQQTAAGTRAGRGGLGQPHRTRPGAHGPRRTLPALRAGRAPCPDIRQLLLAAFEVEHREHVTAIRRRARASATRTGTTSSAAPTA